MTALICDTTKAPIGEPCAPVTIKLESCQGSWLFQPARMRFRRVLRVPGRPGATTDWCPYFGLHFVDADRFVVLLNPQGTRLLHSWRHLPGTVCDACAEPRSDEMLQGEMHQLAG
jgi:hypothetical protein